MNLIYKQTDSQMIRVCTPNDLVVGELIMDVDGYYYFWTSNNGCWPAHVLRSIADKLDDINKKWNDEIEYHFGSSKNVK